MNRRHFKVLSRCTAPAVLTVIAMSSGACGGADPLGAQTDAGSSATDGGNSFFGLPPGAQSCACQIDSEGVLNISWDCFCKDPNEDCNQTIDNPVECPLGIVTLYADCGLIVRSFLSIAGQQTWVYDLSGKLVGQQKSSDDADYPCPTDTTLRSSSRKAGRFLDSSCAGVVCGPDRCGPCAVDGGS